MTRNPFWLFRSLLCFSAIAIGLPRITAQPADSAPLTEELFPQLKPIMAKALSQSNVMLQRNIDIAQAEANKILARSGLLPYLGSSSSYISNTSAVSSNTDVKSRASGLFYSASASQPLYQWGTLKAQLDSAKIGVSIAEKNYAEAYRLLALSIRSQFTGLILKKTGLRNVEFALKLSTTHLELQEERARNKQIPDGALNLPRLDVDEAKLLRDRIQADYDQAIRYFCLLTGLETLDPANVPENISLGGQYYSTPYAGPLLAKFTGTDVEDTFQARIYRDNIKQADLTYKIAKFRLYPKFSLSASYSQANQTSVTANTVDQVGVNSQAVSLVASWPIFDGFATKGAKLSALATKRNYALMLDNYLHTATEQARGLERALDFSSRAMRLADVRRDLQFAAVDIAKQDLARGVSTQSDIDAAIFAYYRSDLAALTARAEFLNKWAEFLSALNRDPALQNLPARFLSHAK